VKASYDYYGRITVDYQSLSRTNAGTKTDIANNESRLGLRGNFAFGNKSETKIIYQIEYGIDPVDGKARGDDGTLKKRNTYLGIQNKLGTIFVGTHDSALKKAQLKVDLFNDLAPDIKNVLHGENRLEDFIGYITPKFQGVFSASFNSIKNSSSSGKKYKSYSLNYSGNRFLAAFAIDEGMKGYDSSRLSFLYPFEGSKLGFIYQETKELSSGMKKNGGVLSFITNINSKGRIKFQYAVSSMKIDSGKHSTIGYDHQLIQGLRIFTFYSVLNSRVTSKEKNIFSIGLEYNF